MKKLKKCIIILSISIMAVIVLFILMQLKQEKQLENKIEDKNIEIPAISKTIDDNQFYRVNQCIKTYLEEIELENAEISLSLLDETYIKENQIDSNNIENYVSQYKEKESYRTKEMYEQTEENYATYWVKARIDQKDTFFQVAIDENNQTFSIMPITQKQYQKAINQKESENNSRKKEINKKVYNVVANQKLSEDKIAKLYYDDFLKTMLYDQEEAYQLLDSDYREKRFQTEESFKNYIEENREKLAQIYEIETLDDRSYENYDEYYALKQKYQDLGVKTYLKEDYEEYTRYICADIYENYYIFYITIPGEYKVIYDNHTIDLPEFIKKYNGANNQIKMGMNVEKFLDAINTKDYTYAYEVLAKSFKDNYYPTQEEFENTIKQDLFEHNNIEYGQYTEEGNLLVYEVIVKDQTNEENNKKMTIVMQLQEGTNFVMSFNIEQ